MAAPIRQPDGTICRTGPNCKRHGGKGVTPATNSPAVAVKKQLDEAKALQSAPQPIVVKKDILLAPYGHAKRTYGVEYEYDAYGCDGCYGCDTGEDYCRGSRYEGLRVETPVDIRRVLSHVFNCAEKDVPDDAVTFGESIGLDGEDAWYVYGVADYYGETVETEMEQYVFDQLREWYYQRDNAEDAFGIYGYVRSKGQVTTGLSPLDALKAQLTAENKGRKISAVEEAKSFRVESLLFDTIHVPHEARYKKIEPRLAKSKINAKAYVGVVARDRQTNSYTLIDGYHRLKSVKESSLRKGEFIILESDKNSGIN